MFKIVLLFASMIILMMPLWALLLCFSYYKLFLHLLTMNYLITFIELSVGFIVDTKS